MRLGQLARKYGVSKKEIIAYLKDIDPSLHSLGQNSKLDEQTVMSIARRFEDADGLFGSSLNQGQAQEQNQGQEQAQEPSEALAKDGKPEQKPEAATHQNGPRKEGETIETDKLLELLESEEASVDLSKFTLIKAPKRELDGLKVVGRIELPETKPREKKEPEIPGKNRRQTRPPLSEAEREQRRLKAKKRRAEYLAREEKRREEKEKKQKKASNRARYQQKLQQAKASQQKHRQPAPKPADHTQMKEAPAPPKTLLGEIWRWFTT